MLYMLCVYIKTLNGKWFAFILHTSILMDKTPLCFSPTHSHTLLTVMLPCTEDNLGFGVLLKDTSTSGQKEAGIKAPPYE